MSCIAHFEILWGFQLYGGDVGKYSNILRTFDVEIVSLSKEDVELASRLCKSRSKVRDYFIGSTVLNRKGYLLTYNVSDLGWVEAYTPEEFVRTFKLK